MASKKLGPQHAGFTHIEDKIAKRQGVSKKTAAKELAASTRRASESAKEKNPALKKVKGSPKGK